MKNLKALTYEEQKLWLRALGKVLFEADYEFLDGSPSITIGPERGDFCLSFRTIGSIPIYIQAQTEFEKAIELGVLDGKI